MTRLRRINTREFWALIRPLLSPAAVAQAEYDHRLRRQ